jgi:membrane-associated protease RseP (regulator of RpoE activity)
VDLYETIGIILGLIIAYFAAIYYLQRTGRIGPEKALTLFGPALMLKTTHGREMLDRAGRFRRFWSVVADLGVLLAGISMVIIVVLLVWEGILITQLPSSVSVSPSEALGIPGINPIIPLGYGLLALIVGIVLHELAHGVVARSQKVGVKSLGILWFVIPVGAFVEQDEDQMMQATRRRRTRIAAAGVLANFFLAVVFFALMSAAVTGTVQPAAHGVGVAVVEANTPAQNISLAPGDIITSVNNTPTTTNTAFENALLNTTPGQMVEITYYQASTGKTVSTVATLAKSPYYTPPHRPVGFLGVGASYLTPGELYHELSWPPGSQFGALAGFVLWIDLPLAQLEPVAGVTTSFFHLTGPLAALGPGGFWVLVNVLFWLSWMNLLLGLSNALPLIPLDGGLLFRDFSAAIVGRLRRGWDAARLDNFAGRLTIISSVVIVALIAWLFVARSIP